QDAFAAATAALNSQPPIRRARLRQVMDRLQNGDPGLIEHELRAYSAAHPDDPDALTMLGNVVAARGRPREAAALFARTLELAPDLDATRFTYAELLFALNRFAEALAQTD